MAVYSGPEISQNGLVLCLDAANIKSYPGSGNVWTNIAESGNNGTLTNGPTFNADNGGSFVFDGTDDVVTFTDVNLLPTVGLTLSVWVKTSTTDKWIIDKQGGAINANVGYSLSCSSNGLVFLYINTTSVSSPSSICTGSWVNVTATWTPSTSLILYVNGSQVAINTTSIPASINNTSDNLQIGRRRAPPSTPIDFWNGNIAQTSIYNRAITASEVQQNFNATRGRYRI